MGGVRHEHSSTRHAAATVVKDYVRIVRQNATAKFNAFSSTSTVAWRRSSWDTGNDKDKPVKVLASSQKGGLLHIHLGVGASHDNGSFRRKRNLLNLFQAGSNRSSCHLRSTVLTCPNVNNLYVRAVLFVEGRLGNLPFRVLRELAPQLEMHRHFARCLPASAAWAQAEQSPRASSSVLRRASKTDSSIARPKASIIFVNFSASSA